MPVTGSRDSPCLSLESWTGSLVSAPRPQSPESYVRKAVLRCPQFSLRNTANPNHCPPPPRRNRSEPIHSNRFLFIHTKVTIKLIIIISLFCKIHEACLQYSYQHYPVVEVVWSVLVSGGDLKEGVVAGRTVAPRLLDLNLPHISGQARRIVIDVHQPHHHRPRPCQLQQH